MKGIDVSYHNGVIDWNKVKQSGMVDFAIIRAGYGKTAMDKQFINNIVGANTAGLKVGIYWFIYAGDEAEAVSNAKKCEDCIGLYKDTITMRVWADWEYDSDKRNPQTKESRTAIVKAFCGYLKSKGYDVGVYSNPDYIDNKFGNLSEYPLWLAKYSSDKGNCSPFMWQYSSSGKIPGIKTKVDMNIYYGDYQETTQPIKRSTICMGSRGADVTYLQQLLSAKGYEVGEIDGFFGEKTFKSTKVYQEEHNLTVDGVVGARTWESLEETAVTESHVKEFSLSVDGDKNISENFKIKEFRCKDGSDKILINTDFVTKKLQIIRDHFGKPVTINSAYRTESYNTKIGGAKSSYHMKGQAFDIVVNGHSPQEVAHYAQTLSIPGIIQYNTFVHVDGRPNRYWAKNNNGKIEVIDIGD